MLTILWEEKCVTAAMFLFFGIGVGIRILLWLIYGSLIRETENMAVTQNAALRQCKTKFIKCFQLNGGVNNIPVFVEKFLSRLEIGPFSFDSLYHLSGQAQLLSVVAAGVGICRGIASGRSIMYVTPYYLACFVEIYLYCSLSAVMNLREKRRILKINLVDYLENHLSARINVTQEDLEKLHYVKPGEKLTEYMPTGKRMETVNDPDIEMNDSKMDKGETVASHNGQDQSMACTDKEAWDALLEEIMSL